MPKPKLEILLLGPPEVLLDGKPVFIKRRLNRALLFYIAAQHHAVTREMMCDLFWPDAAEVVARKNLREALSRLRMDLGVQNLIITEGDQISLNRDLVWVDYRQIDNLLSPLMNSSEMNGGGTLPEWMVDQLKAGFFLGRTHGFMQGMALSGADGFSNWMELENKGYRYTLEKVIDRLVDHFISNGNLEEALIWLGRAVHINPLDENTNYLTLICLRDIGKPNEIIKFSSYLEGLYLQYDLQIPQRFIELKSEALENINPGLGERTGWPEEEAKEPQFIGREHELDVLNRVLRKRGVVVLNGDAGVGKTRLLKQFYTSQPYEPRLLYFQSLPTGQMVPFYTIVHAMRGKVLEGDWQKLDSIEKTLLSNFYHDTLQVSEGSVLFREEGELLPVLEDVFFAAVNLLKTMATQRPLLIIVDDANWMDNASVSFLSFLLEQAFFEKYGMLVFVTSTDTENTLLESLILRTRRLGKVETIELQPLNTQETKQFIHRVVGWAPDGAMVTEIQRLTGGNPYFLIECLRAMKMPVNGSKFLSGIEECAPPEAVIALVQEKIRKFDDETMKILKSAAILGREVQVDLLEEMTDISGERLVVGIEALNRSGILMETSVAGLAGEYLFKHDIEREVVLKKMGAAGSRHLHQRAARATEKRRQNRPEFAFELARHYQAAGEARQAVSAWLEAGRYARSQFSREGTNFAYGRALELIDNSPMSYNEQLIYDVVNEWGNFAYDRDDPNASELIYIRCLKAGEAKQSLLLIGAALSGLGRTADYLRKFDDASEHFQRAIFYLSDTEHHVELGKAFARLGIMHFGIDEYTVALSLLEKALDHTEDRKDPDALDNRVNILSYLCFLYIFTGNPKKAGAIAGELARLSIMVSRRSARVQAHALLAVTEYYNGRVQDALQTCRHNRDLAETLQVRYWLSLLDMVESMSNLHIGNLDRSLELVEQVLQRERDFPHDKLFIHAKKVKADIFRFLGADNKARTYYEELTSHGGNNYQTIESRSFLSFILAKGGNTEDFDNNIHQAIDDAQRKCLAGIELKARITQLLFYRAGGSAEKFEQEAGALAREISDRGLLNHDVYSGWVEALSAELRGETELALTRYRELQQHLIR